MAGSNESYSVSQGSSLAIDVQLNDSAGTPIVTYSGSEPLATTVWPGGTRAASFSAATAWTNPALGTIRIAISAAQTSGLAAGRYQLLTRLTESGLIVDAYSCVIDVLRAAGMDAAPKTYCDPAWLFRYSRGWLRTIQTEDDEAGFAEQLGRARTWLEDVAHAHYRVANIARSVWLQEQLDADKLMVTDQVRETVAKKALAYICESMLGGGSSNDYGKLARMYHSQADYLCSCLTLQLDTNGDGYSDVTIDCTSTNPLYA
jgi:hypothetical protein